MKLFADILLTKLLYLLVNVCMPKYTRTKIIFSTLIYNLHYLCLRARKYKSLITIFL